MKSCNGEVRNGMVILPDSCPFREGQRVRVEALEEQPSRKTSPEPPAPLDANHPACGMWADRSDVTDAVGYSRAVRDRLAQRDRNG